MNNKKITEDTTFKWYCCYYILLNFDIDKISKAFNLFKSRFSFVNDFGVVAHTCFFSPQQWTEFCNDYIDNVRIEKKEENEMIDLVTKALYGKS